MNETVNKFLLAGDKFMPERHLRQPRFTYSACGPFTKNKERINYIYYTNIIIIILIIFIKMNYIKHVFSMI